MYVDPGINTSASNLKWVLPYCKPDLPRVVGALLLFIANNTMALTIPILSGIIVDRVIVGGHADELPRLCGLMILMTIIRVGARYGYQMWMERFGQNSVYRLVSDEYEKLHELDFTYFNHTRTGDIMSRLTSDTDAIRHCLSWVSYQIADSRSYWPASRRSFFCSRAACPRTPTRCSSPSATRWPPSTPWSKRTSRATV